MSHALIARNADLRKLETEGYTLRIVDDGYLLIENVPYVTVHGEVHEGTLVMELTLSGDLTVRPATHVAHWTGEFPYDASGNKLLALIHENAKKGSLSESIPPTYQLSAKPDGGYRNYHHKVTTYVEILSREARCISPDSTAQQWKSHYRPRRCRQHFFVLRTPHPFDRTPPTSPGSFRTRKIAIAGVGGTGSYVLDLVAKTWSRENPSLRRRPISPTQRIPVARSLLPRRTRRRTDQVDISCREILAHAQSAHRAQHMH